MIRSVPDETQHVPDGPLPATPPVTAPSTTLKFGRFQASGTLGAGGMGTVYRATDALLGRDVAIKSLTASGELGVRERFLREARAIGAVHHPNILAVHDVGEEAGTPFLVMELAAGGSLRDRIKAGGMPVETAREVGVHIARALAAAHGANIIHRDVKPGNILCATPLGHAPLWKLADFGIAHLPDSTLTMTGQFLGSPSYAAPESLRAGEYGPASDVYGLGATLYEAIAGTPPHGDHDMQSLIRKLEQDPTPLHVRAPATPGPLADAIMAALARDPAQRPTADTLAQRLALDDRPTVATPAAPAAPVLAAHAAQATVTTAAAASSGGPSMKLIAAGLLAIAVLATVLAVRDRSGATHPLASPAQPVETTPSGSEEGAHPEDEQPTPMIVDQYGNPVDEETAKAILEQMREDAEQARERPGNGRGRGKKFKNN